jgi:hypothetical protein
VRDAEEERMPKWAWECEFSFGPVGSQRFVPGVRIQSCDCEQPKRVQHFRCVHFAKSRRKVTVTSFVVICQILFNHGLTRLKRFVPTFTDKLCN